MKSKSFICEETLGYLVKRTGRSMSKALREQFAAHDLELPIEHWGILVHLWRQDGRSQRELADLVFKDKATITRAIAHLEKLNAVIRIPDNDDKRQNRVYLTHKGRSLQSVLFPIAQSVVEMGTRGISAEEIAICRSVLQRINENLKHFITA
ncbi:MAG: MarR family transcriptional regulator [Bacteroidota bacterium]